MARTPTERSSKETQLRRRVGILELGGAALICLGAVAYLWWGRTPANPAEPDAIRRLDRAEEIILALTPGLKKAARDLANLQLPGLESAPLFGPQITVVDLADREPKTTEEPDSNYRLRLREWPIEPTARRLPNGKFALWAPLLRSVEYFERTKFYFIEADLDPQDDTILQARMGFDGVAQLVDGQRAWLHGKMHVAWQKRPGASAGAADGDAAARWSIVEWRTEELNSTESADPPFFADTTLASLDSEVAEAVRESPLDELFVRLVRDQNYTGVENEDYLVALQWSPGLSVVDIDRDGYDDLFFAKNWGVCRLFHNRGDGTFDDRATEWGLAYENHCTCSLFADFDNDGDSDLFLGRSLRPSLYLENVDGHFVERPVLPDGRPLPALVYSVSAADYNGDGLLDVYFCTYANRLMSLATTSAQPENSRRLLRKLLSAEGLRELLARAEDRHAILDRIGPSNVLLVNRGDGRFDVAPENEQLETWRNSFQATWGDFDADGDADLYVVNDYAPNNLYRNDGPQGFTDITASADTADIGFGMGASWGDYDNDGQADLYVSNMYSKAGRRITARVPGMDPRFALMARGNSLFHNLGQGKFEKVSGTEAPALLVENSGWAWSGQFLDVDNDGFQDIHSLAGNITFPDEVAFDVDL